MRWFLERNQSKDYLNKVFLQTMAIPIENKQILTAKFETLS